MTMNAPPGAYERQLLIERAALHNPEDLRTHEEQEHKDVAEFICAGTEGLTSAGEKCALRVERDAENNIIIPNACAECALATRTIIEQRRAPIEERMQSTKMFTEQLDARATV